MQNQRLNPELSKPAFFIPVHCTTITFEIQMIFSDILWSHTATGQAQCFIPELT